MPGAFFCVLEASEGCPERNVRLWFLFLAFKAWWFSTVSLFDLARSDTVDFWPKARYCWFANVFQPSFTDLNPYQLFLNRLQQQDKAVIVSSSRVLRGLFSELVSDDG